MKNKRIISFLLIQICIVCLFAYNSKQKEKVTYEILSYPNVKSIKEIQGYDDDETKLFYVKMLLDDEIPLILDSVDYRPKNNKFLSFRSILRLDDFIFIQINYNIEKDYIEINAPVGVQNAPENCSEIIDELYANKSVEFLCSNYKEILEEFKKYPIAREEFIKEIDEFEKDHSIGIEWLKKYNYIDYTKNKGSFYLLYPGDYYSFSSMDN